MKTILIIVFACIIGFIPFIFISDMIFLFFYNLIHRHHLIKKCNSIIKEATGWKKDLEFFLENPKFQDTLTFNFENRIETCNYERLKVLLARTTTYINNYNTYLGYVKRFRWDEVNPPNFYSERVVAADFPTFDALMPNPTITIHQQQDMNFLRLLHAHRKFS